MTYKEKVVGVLEYLGGHAYLPDIYAAFKKLYGDAGLAESYRAIIRKIIEQNSSDSTMFNNQSDLFYSVDGIGNGHWGIRNYHNTDSPELSQDDDGFSEGKLSLKQHLQRERNPLLIREAKKAFLDRHQRLFCEVCGFDFGEKYGPLGDGFIEAHHTKPLCEMNPGDKTQLCDIAMVCSNCHSMIHRRKPWLRKEELQAVLHHPTQPE